MKGRVNLFKLIDNDAKIQANNFALRYSEARTLWSTLTVSIREFTRTIWFGIPEHTPKAIVEKKSAINLLVAFAIATKHYLREEYSSDESDLEGLIGHLQPFDTPSSNVSYSLQEQSGMSRRRSSSTRRPTQPQVYVGPSRDPFKARAVGTPSNIPIEISLYLQSFIQYCREKSPVDGKSKCDEATCTHMQQCEKIIELQ